MQRNQYLFTASIRFKGVIAEEYRQDMQIIFLFGNWHASKNKIFEPIQYKPDNMRVAPFKELKYPVEWIGCDEPDQEWQNRFDIKTGEFVFTCTIFDYEEYENFFILTLPFIVSSVDICEVWVENIFKSDPEHKEGQIVRYKLKNFKWKLDKNN